MAGISRAAKPHLVAANRWHDSLNIRFRRGEAKMMPRKVELARPENAFRFPSTFLAALPVGVGGRVKVVSFAGSRIMGLRQDATMVELDGEDDDTNQFLVGDGTFRWAAAPHEGRLFFTNPLNNVGWTEGTVVHKLSDAYTPAGRYITVFFDHVVVANYTQKGSAHPFRFAWSDLYNLNFQPKRTNEADYYDCLERTRISDDVQGVTGLARQGESLWVYTSGYSFRADYVGLPRVLKVTAALPGIGCDIPYGVASNEGEHLFPNLRRRQFYSNRGGQVEEIGNDIIEYFLADLNPTYKDRTWSFYKENDDEAWWVYVSNASDGAFDKAICFNTAERLWYPASVEDIHAYCVGGKIGQSIDELEDTCAELETTCDELGDVLSVGELWGTTNGRLLRSETEDDEVDDLIQSKVPFLETPDYIYGGSSDVKETESVHIDAKSTDGIVLDMSKRSDLAKTVEFVEQPKALASTTGGRLGFPRVSGRAFRYRFRPKANNSADWLPRGTLVCEIGTEVYPEYETFIDGAVDNPVGRFHPPYLGTYAISAVGAGGGGGGRALLARNTASCSVIPNLFYPLTQTSREKPLVENFYGNQSSIDLQAYVGGTAVKIGVEAVGDPNFATGINQEIRTAICDALVAAVEQFEDETGATVTGFTCFGWQAVNATSYIDAADWFNKTNTLRSAEYVLFVPKVFFAYVPANARPIRHAGGGGGNWGEWTATIANLVTDKIDYEIGLPTNLFTVDGHVLGGKGGDTVVRGNGWTATIKGGGRGGYDPISATFFDGTSSASVFAGISALRDTEGDDAIAEAPTTGAPITTHAKGGRGFRADGTRTYYRGADKNGFEWGGGGCGIGEDAESNPLSCQGYPGYVKIAYRLDPVNLTAYSTGGFYDNIAKRALKRRSIATFQMGGEATILYTVRLRIHSVTELQTYVGGDTSIAGVSKGGNPSGTTTVLKLETGRETYYLNHGSTLGFVACHESTKEFTIRVYGQSTLRLTMDNIDSTQAEPRRVTANTLIDTSIATDLHEPQFCVVEIEPEQLSPHNVRTFEFNGFVEHVYGGEAEK